MKPEPLIDSAFLEKLERLAIRWQKSFPGLVGGHNISHFAGAGQEFLDHRQFHQGDDLRAVNWRAFLRLEKLFLKMFQVEPRIPVRILLDCSNSMTTGAVSKFDYARKLAAALCYVGLVRLDTIGLQPFDQEKWGKIYPGMPANLALESFSALRKWNLQLIHDALPTAANRKVTHPERGTMTFETIVKTMAGHDLNHLGQLRKIAEKPA